MEQDSPIKAFRLVASNPDNPHLKLYRGTALEKLDPNEVAQVIGDGDKRLKTVIDMRTDQEIGESTDYPVPEGVHYRVLKLSRSGDFEEIRSAAETSSEQQSSVLTFYRIDLYTLTKVVKMYAGLFWNNWRSALTGWTSDRFDTNSGVAKGVLKKLSIDVAHCKGLGGLYMDWLDPAMDCSRLVSIFRLLSDPDIYPALVHCQYGKDRTGVVSALLQLMDPNMTEDEVVNEYHATEAYLGRLVAEIETKMSQAKMPQEFARCPKELIIEVIDWIRSRYGTVEQYLTQIGLSEAELAAIKANLGYSTMQASMTNNTADCSNSGQCNAARVFQQRA